MLQFPLESPLPFDESAGFTAPSAFGTYRVLHQIGSGVLGPVFRTYDPQHDRLVAVKAFRLEMLPEQVARLADALRRLTGGAVPSHGVIVPVFDAGFEGTTPYLAGAYVTAETLDVTLRHLAPAPLDQALPAIVEIAAAIDAAWSAGVGHGALHPRDIFVTADGKVVGLTGMGVVQAIERVGVKAAGRRPYTAPERGTGERWDIRADVYSLGAITHELLTRRRPAGSGEQDGALAGETSPAQRVQIRRVLSAALAERPANRFPSARAFAEALAAIGRGDLPLGAFETADLAGSVERVPAAGAAAGLPVVPLGPVSDGPAHESAVLAPIAIPAGSSGADLVPLISEGPPPAEPTGLLAEIELEQTAHDAPTEFVPADRLRAPHPVLSRGLLNPAEEALPRTSFPWFTTAIVALAGIAVGVLLGYQVGRQHVQPTSFMAGAAPAGAAQTDVPVPPEPVVAPEPAPKSSEPAAPAKTNASPQREGPTSRAPRPADAASAGRASDPVGRLIVRSTPPGAMVRIDGHPRGETPLTLTDLSLGRHTVDIARSGFVPHHETMALTAGDPSRTVAIELQAGIPMPGADAAGGSPVAVGAGAIYVDSRPQAARVMIDGRFAGTTPVRVPDVRSGNHVVRIERTGYNAFSQSVDVQAGGQARVTAALEERQEQ